MHVVYYDVDKATEKVYVPFGKAKEIENEDPQQPKSPSTAIDPPPTTNEEQHQAHQYSKEEPAKETRDTAAPEPKQTQAADMPRETEHDHPKKLPPLANVPKPPTT